MYYLVYPYVYGSMQEIPNAEQDNFLHHETI